MVKQEGWHTVRKNNLILVSRAQDERLCAGMGMRVAHLCYALGTRSLLRTRDAPDFIGGLLGITDEAPLDLKETDVRSLSVQIKAECERVRAEGVLLDFESFQGRRLLPQLCTELRFQKVMIYAAGEEARGVREATALLRPGAESDFREFVRSGFAACAGGAALELTPMQMGMCLSDGRKAFAPLKDGELEMLFRRYGPSVYYSKDRCAKYFTVAREDGQSWFIVYDDAATLLSKLAAAEEEGVATAFSTAPEIAPYLRDMLAE